MLSTRSVRATSRPRLAHGGVRRPRIVPRPLTLPGLIRWPPQRVPAFERCLHIRVHFPCGIARRRDVRDESREWAGFRCLRAFAVLGACSDRRPLGSGPFEPRTRGQCIRTWRARREAHAKRGSCHDQAVSPSRSNALGQRIRDLARSRKVPSLSRDAKRPCISAENRMTCRRASR